MVRGSRTRPDPVVAGLRYRGHRVMTPAPPPRSPWQRREGGGRTQDPPRPGCGRFALAGPRGHNAPPPPPLQGLLGSGGEAVGGSRTRPDPAAAGLR